MLHFCAPTFSCEGNITTFSHVTTFSREVTTFSHEVTTFSREGNITTFACASLLFKTALQSNHLSDFNKHVAMTTVKNTSLYDSFGNAVSSHKVH